MKPHLLFVSHSASRNGATILLLHLLQWLRWSTDYELEVLMSGTGELLPDFRAVCKTTVWRNPAVLLEGWPQRWRSRWEAPIGSKSLACWAAGRRYDLVYCNTCAVSAYVPILAKHTEALLWHIHELEHVLRLAMGEARIRDLFPKTSRFIAVSQSVRDVLIHRCGVAPEIVDVVNGFVSVPTQPQTEAAAIRVALRRELGWPENAFVVGGCGSPGWRKGTDAFLQVAQRLCRIPGNEATRFLWVGGARRSEELLEFEHDASILGLADRCKIVPNTPAATDYYRAMDVFALTSREDPFPLVMLEAAACHLPTVCFEHSGGGPEFVGQEAGSIVPYLDTARFAGELDRLRAAPQLRRRQGAMAAQRVLQRHVVEIQGPKILATINRCLASRDRYRSLSSRTATRHG